MATDLRGLFENNRRREVNAVTTAIPYVIEAADVREGTAEVVAASGDYTVLTLPAGVLLTSISLIMETDSLYGAASTAAISVGGSSVLAATAINAAGVTAATAPVLVEGGSADVVITLVVAGTNTAESTVRVAYEYIDYARATMSYIGEQ